MNRKSRAKVTSPTKRAPASRADWKKRFPPPGGRGKVKRMAPAYAVPNEDDED